MVKTVNQPEGL